MNDTLTDVAVVAAGSTLLAAASLGVALFAATVHDDWERINACRGYRYRYMAAPFPWFSSSPVYMRSSFHADLCKDQLLPKTRILPVPKWRRQVKLNLRTGEYFCNRRIWL